MRTEPQRGTFVFTLTAKELADICDVRVCLEVAALRASMARAPETLVGALAATVEAMTSKRRANDDQAYLHLDTQFHQCLFDHADNRFLDEAYHTIASKMAALRNRLGMHPDHMKKSYEEHKAILRSLRKRDLERAEAILISHIGRKEGSYWNLEAEGDEAVARLGVAL
ncbi:MAG: GntR family transcriptional regulator [Pseudomonadota bacterium]